MTDLRTSQSETPYATTQFGSQPGERWRRFLPEHFMGAPEKPVHDEDAETARPEDAESADEAEDNFGQWVALVVLLACWLAEAYM